MKKIKKFRVSICDDGKNKKKKNRFRKHLEKGWSFIAWLWWYKKINGFASLECCPTIKSIVYTYFIYRIQAQNTVIFGYTHKLYTHRKKCPNL